MIGTIRNGRDGAADHRRAVEDADRERPLADREPLRDDLVAAGEVAALAGAEPEAEEGEVRAARWPSACSALAIDHQITAKVSPNRAPLRSISQPIGNSPATMPNWNADTMMPYCVLESVKISRSFGAVTDSVWRSTKLMTVTKNSIPRIHQRTWRCTGGISRVDGVCIGVPSPRGAGRRPRAVIVSRQVVIASPCARHEALVLVADPVALAGDAPDELQRVLLREHRVVVEHRDRHQVALVHVVHERELLR